MTLSFTTKLITTSICILLFFNWQELSISGGLGFTRNNLAWLLLSSVLSYSIYSLLKQQRIILPTHWLLGFVGVLLAMLPFYIQVTDAFSYGLWLPIGLFAAWLSLIAFMQLKVINDNKQLLITIIILCAFAQSLIGTWQIFHDFMMQYTSNTEPYKLPSIDGTFNQRNLLASFISTGLIAALYSQSYSAKWLKSNTLDKVIILFLFTGTFVLFYTNSRVGIYSFVISAVLLLIPTLKNNYKKTLIMTIPILVGISASILIQHNVYSGNGKDFSRTQGRQVMYQTSYEAIKDAPLIGHGLGSFEKVYLDKLAELRKNGVINTEKANGRPENVSHPHNELLYWGIQGGLVSVLGLLLLALSIVLAIFGQPWKKQLAYYSLLFPITLHLMVELPFYISAVHLIVFIMLIAYILLQSNAVVNYPIKTTFAKPAGFLGIILMLVISAVLALNIYSLRKAVQFETALNKEEKTLKQAIVQIGWKDKYQSLLLRNRANIAARTGKKQPQIDYFEWLKTQNVITPRLQYYFNLYYSYKLQNDSVNANLIREEIILKYGGVVTADEWLRSNH